MIGRFAKELLHRRLYLGYTQRDYARALGVPPSSYVTWERGLGLPSFENLALILHYYKYFYSTAADLRKAYTSDKTRAMRKKRKTLRGARPK